MDFRRKLENILQDIQEIENDAVDLSNAQDISKIEMDLLMGKVRGLYDKLIQIDRHHTYSQDSEYQDIPIELTRKAGPSEAVKAPAETSGEPEWEETPEEPEGYPEPKEESGQNVSGDTRQEEPQEKQKPEKKMQESPSTMNNSESEGSRS